MPAVKKLLHTRMRVNDIERTVKFYQDALNLTIERRSVSPRGAQIVFLNTPNSEERLNSARCRRARPRCRCSPT